VTSGRLDGDDGGFYFPYILDPGFSASMLIGTCRVWRGPRTGGVFSALSPNFDTLGYGTCSGSEVNQIRGLAAAGKIDSNGSGTIYATTSGYGPVEGPFSSPAGGRVWVTTNATAGPGVFADTTDRGPQGNINPNQYPISSVATDSSDASGNTAYTVMGFTGGIGHVWKTTNAGGTWTDFTGNLPDSPVNAVVVYAPMAQVFVGTDGGCLPARPLHRTGPNSARVLVPIRPDSFLMWRSQHWQSSTMVDSNCCARRRMVVGCGSSIW